MRILVAALLWTATSLLGQTVELAPEAASGRTQRQAVHARHYIIATANPHASAAGLQMLRAGGGALDAAIAAQMVLNLVEPQSSGIGGGAFLLHWDGAAGRVAAFDGRETAPAAARPDRFLRPDGTPMELREAIASGRAVGVPGLLRMLHLAHERHGRLPWARLFEPAIRLAEEGFAVSPRLHALIRSDPALARNAAARAHFYSGEGTPLRVGHRLRNPELAALLRRVALEGPEAFYRGEVARDIVAAVAADALPGDLSEADLAGYQALEREPVCGSYRAHRICGMPPPSSGGIGVLALLGALERFPLARMRAGSAQTIHLFAEAGRLAYADRDHYVGDPAFVPVPTAGLVNRAYLRQRAALVRPQRSMGRAAHGTPPGAPHALGADTTLEATGTSHLSVIDAQGNAVALTSSIESAFGSRIMVRGFLLNNQLTDFAFSPEHDGRALANRVEPGKRPRSSMAPTLVFAPGGRLYAALGSAGGSQIINYVAKALVVMLDWNYGIQDAIAAPNMGSRNGPTELERTSSAEAFADALRALGHPVFVHEMTSGTQGVARRPQGLAGGADPRREGLALGE
jgi:gamma-glutamyltranspeptidase/glutathione hydrolase